MTSNRPVGTVFRDGDEVVLVEGSYQGTPGRFLRLKEDVNWADITERDGRIRSHPLAWLAHSTRGSEVPRTDATEPEGAGELEVESTHEQGSGQRR